MPSIGVHIKLNQIQTRTNLGHKPQGKKVAPNSKFVGHSTEIIQQSKIKGPLYRNSIAMILNHLMTSYSKHQKLSLMD